MRVVSKIIRLRVVVLLSSCQIRTNVFIISAIKDSLWETQLMQCQALTKCLDLLLQPPDIMSAKFGLINYNSRKHISISVPSSTEVMSPHIKSVEELKVLGINLSTFNPPVQFFICVAGVFVFYLIYGYLQVHKVMPSLTSQGLCLVLFKDHEPGQIKIFIMFRPRF